MTTTGRTRRVSGECIDCLVVVTVEVDDGRAALPTSDDDWAEGGVDRVICPLCGDALDVTPYPTTTREHYRKATS